jgi:hypothetical protein
MPDMHLTSAVLDTYQFIAQSAADNAQLVLAQGPLRPLTVAEEFLAGQPKTRLAFLEAVQTAATGVRDQLVNTVPGQLTLAVRELVVGDVDKATNTLLGIPIAVLRARSVADAILEGPAQIADGILNGGYGPDLSPDPTPGTVVLAGGIFSPGPTDGGKTVLSRADRHAARPQLRRQRRINRCASRRWGYPWEIQAAYDWFHSTNLAAQHGFFRRAAEHLPIPGQRGLIGASRSQERPIRPGIRSQQPEIQRFRSTPRRSQEGRQLTRFLTMPRRAISPTRSSNPVAS